MNLVSITFIKNIKGQLSFLIIFKVYLFYVGVLSYHFRGRPVCTLTKIQSRWQILDLASTQIWWPSSLWSATDVLFMGHTKGRFNKDFLTIEDQNYD